MAIGVRWLGGAEPPKGSLGARGQHARKADPPWEGEEGGEEKDEDGCERSNLGEGGEDEKECWKKGRRWKQGEG